MPRVLGERGYGEATTSAVAAFAKNAGYRRRVCNRIVTENGSNQKDNLIAGRVRNQSKDGLTMSDLVNLFVRH